MELEGVLSKETAKALLEDAIAAAKELSDEMTEGDGAGQWAAGSKETLDEAIQAAEEVYTKENACLLYTSKRKGRLCAYNIPFFQIPGIWIFTDMQITLSDKVGHYLLFCFRVVDPCFFACLNTI